MKNLDLTIRETELLEYIIKFKQTNGFSPTVREMATLEVCLELLENFTNEN